MQHPWIVLIAVCAVLGLGVGGLFLSVSLVSPSGETEQFVPEIRDKRDLSEVCAGIPEQTDGSRVIETDNGPVVIPSAGC